MPKKRAREDDEPVPEVMLATEVADYLRVGYSTVMKMTHAGELPAVRLGREFRYLRSEIENLMRHPAPSTAPSETDQHHAADTDATEAEAEARG